MAHKNKLPYAVPIAGRYGKVRRYYRLKLAFLLEQRSRHSAQPWKRPASGL
jgi:hypothetical protein